MSPRAAAIGLALGLYAATAHATPLVWLVGGGAVADASQIQIELNVEWVAKVLRERSPESKVALFFASGPGDLRDVKAWSRPADDKLLLQPWARVFGSQVDSGNSYRRHRIADVVGSTRAPELSKRLSDDLANMKGGDRALLVYNGHGLREPKDPAENSLRLWGETRLTARELESILGKAPPSVPVRFVLTQCFSGGFARVVRPGARDVVEIADGTRCGFMAESETRESEGCTDSVNTSDYRDYTTFFFAALNGKDRNGAPLAANPDLDGDGTTSLYEAHLYVMAEAESADLPRSTSETYLERWRPWYLRWLDTGDEPENVYGRLARRVAASLGLPPSGRALVDEVDRRRAALVQESARLAAERDRLAEQAAQLQRRIQADLRLRWPEAMHPHTLAYATFLREDVQAAQDFILAHPDYPELVRLQDRHQAMATESLGLERKTTRLEQVRRLRELARLLDRFERLASRAARDAYGRILSCEKLPL